MKEGKSYEVLDHTADLRIRIFGDTRANLMRNAGLSLYDLIVRSDPVAPLDKIVVDVDGDDPVELMVNFLRELLYQWAGNDRIVQKIEIVNISDIQLTAQVSTSPFSPDHDEILQEIKAVTYHQAEVIQTEGGWEAVIVFDI